MSDGFRSMSREAESDLRNIIRWYKTTLPYTGEHAGAGAHLLGATNESLPRA